MYLYIEQKTYKMTVFDKRLKEHFSYSHNLGKYALKGEKTTMPIFEKVVRFTNNYAIVILRGTEYWLKIKNYV